MANQETAVKLLQAMLQAEIGTHDITPSLIAEKLDWLLQHGPQFSIDPDRIDRQATVDEMVRRFSLWIGHDTMLTSDTGHEAWLVSARKQGWRYWPRYREWLDASLPATVIDAMDRSTDRVLGQLEDPLRHGAWDRRGLVVGNVQSGKTGHYIGLVSKAADAGYKIVIVLAGLHNNLRSQTQMRLDEGFLGYETTPREEDIRRIGVGTIDGDPSIQPNFATNRTNSGDFTTRVARNLGISPEQRPWLFVVKKNKTVLNRLLQWIRNHVVDLHDSETGRRVVTKLPLLMIDDEADHASVDTRELVVDEAGRPDEDHQPTAINRLVRRILHSFVQSAYVGYTATPFANIFIHERASTREEGPDLFPAAFIVNLAAPSDYVGSARIFGDRDENATPLDLVRTVDDYPGTDGSGWMPLRHQERPRAPVSGRGPAAAVAGRRHRRLRARVRGASSPRPDGTAFIHADPRDALHVRSERGPSAGGIARAPSPPAVDAGYRCRADDREPEVVMGAGLREGHTPCSRAGSGLRPRRRQSLGRCRAASP